jgi:ADP-heptose:LPS heptosyltransferase
VARRVPGHRVVAASEVLGLDMPAPPKIFVSDATRAKAKAIVGEGPVLALGPTANWIGKEWPHDRFVELAARLTVLGAPLAGAKILVLASQAERSRLSALLDALPRERLIDAVGTLDLLTAHACLERVALFVGNDSGLMHLAAAAGAPTLGLFGPSDEALYGPWGSRAASVRGPESYAAMIARGIRLSGNECHMLGLSVDRAERAALDLLARTMRETGAHP